MKKSKKDQKKIVAFYIKKYEEYYKMNSNDLVLLQDQKMSSTQKLALRDAINQKMKEEIKDKRNRLAHGEQTFYDVGKDFSVREIEKFKNETFEYLSDVINKIEEFIENKKYLKANWVNDNIEDIPPRIYDLQSVYSQTDLDLETDNVDFLDTINRWNIEGRYPDFKFSLYKLATDAYTEKQFYKLKTLKSCLLEGL